MSETKQPAIKVEIGAVKPGELAELASLAARSFRNAHEHMAGQKDLAQDMAENRSVAYLEKSLESSTVLVAKYDGKIVGYAQYGTVKIPEARATQADRELGRLYVETNLHGRGIGRQLIDAVLVDPYVASAPNVFLQVLEENQRAVALYQSYGFKKCGVTTFELGSKPIQELIMVRRQAPDF